MRQPCWKTTTIAGLNTMQVIVLLLLTGLLLAGAGCTGTDQGEKSPAQATVTSPAPGPAEANATLVAFVNEAAGYAQSRGSGAALQEFSNPKGSFVRGDLYIYAYGFNGTTLAHPVNPETIGKLREGEIGRFVREMGAVVKNGSGFYRFEYINPAHNNRLEAKLGYGVQVEDDWWLGSGVYLGPVEISGTAGTGPQNTPGR